VIAPSTSSPKRDADPSDAAGAASVSSDANSADATQSHPHSVGAALRTVSGVTTLSRFSGLARDALCSRIFGAGPVWSAFAFAFLLPNLFRRLFGEGALSAAFLPQYARFADQDRQQARLYAGATVRMLVIALGGATVLGELILLSALILTSETNSGSLALRLAIVMLPFMPMVCTTAIFGAMLQCRNRFAIPAAAPILVNVCIITAAAVWSFGLGATTIATIYAVSVAVLLAGVLQIIWSIRALRDDRPTILGDASSVRPALRTTLRTMAPVAIGMSALQINTLLDGLIASWPLLVGSTISLPFMGRPITYPLDEASNAILFFGQRLYHFPLGVFGIALATAVFPALSRTTHDMQAFGATLRRGVRLSLFIGIPASIGLLLVRDPLITVIYRGGEFSADDGRRVANVLLGYAPGIWAFGLTHVLTRAFYAHSDTRTPMRISLVAIGVNLILNVSLLWTLREAALAWSTTISAIGQCAALSVLGRRKWGVDLFDRELAISVVRIVALSAVMGLAVVSVDRLMSIGPTWSGQLFRLGLLLTAGVGAFGLLAAALRVPELAWLIEKPPATNNLDTHQSKP